VDSQVSRSLKLEVTPFARCGDKIVAVVEARNVSETLLVLEAPDTVVIEQPVRQSLGSGSFKREVEWTVAHVQPGTTVLVEITATAGSLIQMGLCRVTS
jgi:hypothetical protein